MPKKLRLDGIEKVQTAQDRLRKKYSQDTTTLYEDMAEKYHSQPGGRPMYWYVFGYTDLGKPVFLGPEMSENEADRKADEAGLHDVQIKSYNTKDLAKASRMIKADLLAQMDADQALARMKHKLPERR